MSLGAKSPTGHAGQGVVGISTKGWPARRARRVSPIRWLDRCVSATSTPCQLKATDDLIDHTFAKLRWVAPERIAVKGRKSGPLQGGGHPMFPPVSVPDRLDCASSRKGGDAQCDPDFWPADRGPRLPGFHPKRQ